jgi:hypothetical protein
MRSTLARQGGFQRIFTLPAKRFGPCFCATHFPATSHIVEQLARKKSHGSFLQKRIRTLRFPKKNKQILVLVLFPSAAIFTSLGPQSYCLLAGMTSHDNQAQQSRFCYQHFGPNALASSGR